MKKLNLLFFVIVVLFIFSLTFEKSFSQTVKLVAENLGVAPKKEYVVDSISLFAFVERKENEAKIEAFFKAKNLPLSTHAAKFAEVADKYDLDPFLLPAISIKESSGGKKVFKAFNPFGYGKKSFQSYDEAIEYVAYQLTHGKYYKGKTLEKKLKTYNSVKSDYTRETFLYMKKIGNQKIDSINYLNYIDSFKVEKARPDLEIQRGGTL